jgi:hypothetical protein
MPAQIAASSASFLLQDWVQKTLIADETVKKWLGNRVYDDVPKGAVFPYAQLGEDDVFNIGAECMPGGRHTFAIVVFTQGYGSRQAKEIAAAIVKALNERDDMAIAGFDAGVLSWNNTSHRRHPDDATQFLARVAFVLELRPNS